MTRSASEPYVPHGVEALRTYGDGFAGREAELAALDRAWNEDTRVFVLYAEGGAGKTRVVAKWLTQVRDDGWRGAERVFVHSFYSQGSDERRNASSELFFEQALEHFGHTGPRLTDPTEQGRTLARLLVEQHGLLVLDGLEPLQHPPSFDQGRLKDLAIHSLLRSLAAGRMGDPSRGGLCVVTSRQPVQELQDKIGRMVVQRLLDRLDAAAGVELLRQLEVRGPERELREAVEDAHGHAYSLMLLGSYLRDATANHEIRRRREIPLLKEDEEHRYHARHLFGAYVEHLGEASPEVAVLRLLGFFDRPTEEKLLAVLREATESELNALCAPLRKLSPADWRRVLRRLTVLRLIDVSVSPSPPIESHPLLREYFAEQLRAHFSKAWQAGHRRLFEHLCTTTEYRPETLAGLQPLYQAVAHGCLAGLHPQALSDVYIARILRGTEPGGFYSARKLGAISADLEAIACFFVVPWTVPATNLGTSDHTWLLSEAAYRLQALGRLSEAVELMRPRVEGRDSDEDRKTDVIAAINLSGVELMLGEISAAVAIGEQAVTAADYKGDATWEMASRAILAHARHQAGRHKESRHLFAEAESREICYSLAGFFYCDLLLSEAERAAWQCWLFTPTADSVADLPETGPREPLATHIAACDAVGERANYTRKLFIRANIDRLSAALDYLSLARSTFYKAQLTFSIPHSTTDHLTAAMTGLRVSGDVNYLPHCLLTHGWLRMFSGDEAGCQETLDEAWEIAERGPMPLFQADIQLTRARLFRDRAALAEARRLIEKHGYHRRDGELADAEAAAERWGPTPALPGERVPASDALSDVRKEPAMSDELKPLTNDQGFDVFLSHSNKDKLIVRQLKERLVERNLSVWLDEDQARPGVRWQKLLEEGIRKSRSIAVLVGAGLGPWESEEMEAALRLAVNDGRAVIPVLLPGAPDDVELPLVLTNRTWVDLRSDITDQELDRLVWGITSQKPDPR